MNDYDTLADSQVVSKLLDENIHAFKCLYYRYTDDLYRFIFARLRDKETAADYVQDIFVKIWENRKKLDPNASIKAYMFTMAHNRIIDHYRKNAVHKTELAETFPENPDQSENIDLQTRIQLALQNLPENEALVFQLARFDGFTYKEIAAICSVSVKTIEKRMSKALELLRQDILD